MNNRECNGVCVHAECQETSERRTPTLKRFRWARVSKWCTLSLLIAVVLFAAQFARGYQGEKEQERLNAKTIVADRYELRGTDKKLKAALSKGANGNPSLEFFDSAGKSRLRLYVDADGCPHVFLADDNGTLKMSLSLLQDDGTPSVVLHDADGDAAAHLGIVGGLGPDFTLGKQGEGQISLSLDADGSPSFSILDANGKPRLQLLASRDEPSISLIGPGEVARAKWQVLPDGSACLALADRQANQRLVLATDKDGRPSIRFIDQNKLVVKEIK
jgi:hypothetical protein